MSAKKTSNVKPTTYATDSNGVSNNVKGANTFWLAGILLITAIVFANSLSNGFIINWDDDGYILNNPLITDLSWDGIKTIFTVPHLDNYHPLTTLSNAMELALFGMDPKPFHVINLLLHLTNTYLTFRFIQLLCGRTDAAAVTALLFGIHPMHVESVAWISERKDLLYALFLLFSLIDYLRYIDQKKASFYVWSLLFFLCSILSKPAAVALAPLLLFIDYYKDRKFTQQSLLEKIPYFLLSLIFGLLALRIQQASGSTDLAPVFPFIERIFLACYAVAYYLIKVVAPFGLSALHPYPEASNLSWVYYASPLLLILFGVIIYKAGSMRKYWLFGFAFFLIMIALVIQLVPVGRAIVAERYTYVPYIGLFFVLVMYYSFVKEKKFAWTGKLFPTLDYVFYAFIALLLLFTWNRNKDWKDSYTLFSAAIETDPDNYFAYMTRARGELLLGKYPSAASDYSEAIRLKPQSTEAWYSRGVVNEKLNASQAIADYNQAISLSATNDQAYYNRGNLKMNAKDYVGAMRDYDTVMSIYILKGQKKILPGMENIYAKAVCNRGAAKFNSGNAKEAVADYTRAIELDVSLPNAYSNRGNAYLSLGDSVKACNDWQEALRLGMKEMQGNINSFCH